MTNVEQATAPRAGYRWQNVAAASAKAGICKMFGWTTALALHYQTPVAN